MARLGRGVPQLQPPSFPPFGGLQPGSFRRPVGDFSRSPFFPGGPDLPGSGSSPFDLASFLNSPFAQGNNDLPDTLASNFGIDNSNQIVLADPAPLGFPAATLHDDAALFKLGRANLNPNSPDFSRDLAGALNTIPPGGEADAAQGFLQFAVQGFENNPGLFAQASPPLENKDLGETPVQRGGGGGAIPLGSSIFNQEMIDLLTQGINSDLLKSLFPFLSGTDAIEAFNQLTGGNIPVNQGPPQLTSSDIAKLGTNQVI